MLIKAVGALSFVPNHGSYHGQGKQSVHGPPSKPDSQLMPLSAVNIVYICTGHNPDERWGSFFTCVTTNDALVSKKRVKQTAYYTGTAKHVTNIGNIREYVMHSSKLTAVTIPVSTMV